MKSTFNVSGMEVYIENLMKAGKDVDLVAREVLAEVAKDMHSEMLSKCPTDSLLEYIRIHTPTSEGHYNYVNVGILYGLEYTPGDVMRKANAIEYGHIKRNGKGNVAPIPFIRPAVIKGRAKLNQLAEQKFKAAGLADS